MLSRQGLTARRYPCRKQSLQPLHRCCGQMSCRFVLPSRKPCPFGLPDNKATDRIEQSEDCFCLFCRAFPSSFRQIWWGLPSLWQTMPQDWFVFSECWEDFLPTSKGIPWQWIHNLPLEGRYFRVESRKPTCRATILCLWERPFSLVRYFLSTWTHFLCVECRNCWLWGFWECVQTAFPPFFRCCFADTDCREQQAVRPFEETPWLLLWDIFPLPQYRRCLSTDWKANHRPFHLYSFSGSPDRGLQPLPTCLLLPKRQLVRAKRPFGQMQLGNTATQMRKLSEQPSAWHYRMLATCSLIFSSSSFILTTKTWMSASFALEPKVLISLPISWAINPNFFPWHSSLERHCKK